jgi:hypothetical protein
MSSRDEWSEWLLNRRCGRNKTELRGLLTFTCKSPHRTTAASKYGQGPAGAGRAGSGRMSIRAYPT